MNILLWVFQVLLALLFLAAGVPKLIFSTEDLMKMGPPDQVVLPGAFIKFIGVCELLGALGLILPGLLRRQQYLTPLAAAGLTIIMIGAVVIGFLGLGLSGAIVPLVVGVLSAVVAYGRGKLQPLR